MRIIDNLFKENIIKEKNSMLIWFVVGLTFLLLIFMYFFITVKFYEIYESHGVLVPSNTVSISTNFDGFINENNISVGKHYKKNELLVNFDKKSISRDIAFYQNKLLNQKKLLQDINGFVKRIQLDDLKFSINDTENRIKNLKNILNENSIVCPFDCIVVSSSFEGYTKGFFQKGSILCKIVSTEKPQIKIPITEIWSGKIKTGMTCIFKSNNNFKFNSKVIDVRLGEKDDKYKQYAHVLVDKIIIEKYKFDLGTNFSVKIISDKISIKDMIMRTLK